MKKTTFFNENLNVEEKRQTGRKKKNHASAIRFLLGMLLWLLLAGQSELFRMQQGTAWDAEKERDGDDHLLMDDTEEKMEETRKKMEEAGEKTEEAGKKETQRDLRRIRVVLMDTGYQSYFHPSVTVIFQGKTYTYHTKSKELAEGSLTLSSPEGFTLTSIERACGTPHYEGALRIYAEPEGLILVNILPLETYLKSVVPSEMPAEYEEEARKAQAVCARTYAAKQMQEQRMKRYHADVDDSVNCQVYANIERNEATDRAVEETAGKVLQQDGELIEATYFSTSSGQTSTNEIWGKQQALPYLKSVSCPFDQDAPWSSWETTVPWERLENQLQEYLEQTETEGKDAKKADPHPIFVHDLVVTGKSLSGAVTELTIYYTFEGEKNPERTAVIQGEYNVRKVLAPVDQIILQKNGDEAKGGSLLPSAYIELEITKEKELHIFGKGYGHGVGMSQSAANEMAKQGYRSDEILHYFFRDVIISKAGSS